MGGPVRHVWFLTGTRADFGKLKPLIAAAAAVPGVRVTVLATGMHLLDRYGYTVLEVRRLPPPIRVREFANQAEGATSDEILADTVRSLGRLLAEQRPDLLVVHGDRIEALGGAAAGALLGIRVAHVEGGERSGTIDGVLRHAVSKLSHVHLVANEEAAQRVEQLGEDPASVHVIGSPDIDVMLSSDLPSLESVFDAYDLDLDPQRYAIALLHSVTTEPPEAAGAAAAAMLDALAAHDLDAVVVYPNNDPGGAAILDAYEQPRPHPRLRFFPSVRFEAFLTLLRHARAIVGNSSAGVREAPLYGVPAVNIGSRQRDRSQHGLIVPSDADAASIGRALELALAMERRPITDHFGSGDSALRFASLLTSDELWSVDLDKRFLDLPRADQGGGAPR